ncbi:MAG: nickel-responsive transcriptional regulator NikR [Elusimicrobia bacterium]|nr:nickel-responsive transcriptional regulator NikR [Elusimicrobiota bacterium]
MGKLLRFGVSLDEELLKKFDKLIKEKKYTNRSKAIADLICQEFVKEQWTKGGDIAGAITLIYDHHKRELVDKLMNIQHDFQKAIVSTQHIHLDHDICLEIIAVRGSSAEVKKLADSLKAMKGVKHSTLSVTAA